MENMHTDVGVYRVHLNRFVHRLVFKHIEILLSPSLNYVSISQSLKILSVFSFLGKQNKLRVYYLSWLKAKILKGEEV